MRAAAAAADGRLRCPSSALMKRTHASLPLSPSLKDAPPFSPLHFRVKQQFLRSLLALLRKVIVRAAA